MFPYSIALKLIKLVPNFTESTNSVLLTINSTLTVINCCAPYPIKLTAYCVGIVRLIDASIAFFNLIIIGLRVDFITKIYKQC